MNRTTKMFLTGFLLVFAAAVWSGGASALNLFTISQISVNTSGTTQNADANGGPFAFALNYAPTIQNSSQLGMVLAPNVNGGPSYVTFNQHAEANPSVNQKATATARWAAVAINIAPVVITNVQVGIVVSPTINILGNPDHSTQVEFNQTFENNYGGVNQQATASGGVVNIAQNFGPTIVVNPSPFHINVSPTININ